MPDPAPEEVPECDFGRCNPAHPLHCCHIAIGTRELAGPKGFVLCGWKCVVCGKRSRVQVLRRGGLEMPKD